MNEKRPWLLGALVGVLVTVPWMAVLYVANILAGLPFPPFDLFGALTRALPGPLITWGLDLMIDTLILVGLDVADTAKLAEQIMALGFFLLVGALDGAVFFALFRRRADTVRLGLLVGAALGLALWGLGFTIGGGSGLVGLVWLLALFLGWGAALGWALARTVSPAPGVEAPPVAIPDAPVSEVEAPLSDGVQRLSRRQFLIVLGSASATITVVGAGLAAVLESGQGEQVASGPPLGPTPTPGPTPLPVAVDPLAPAPGTRPEITAVADHYKVFIGLQPSVVKADGYRLPITGLVDNPLELSLDDLRQNYPAVERWVTLSCISGRIPTTLIGTVRWTGVSLQQILNDAGVQPEARFLRITSADDFHEIIDLDLIASDPRIMLCYAWDGQPLPVDHGFPLRVWIPDRFGMKQPKWITAMEVTDRETPGYWVQRGWDKDALVRTRSVIDTVAVQASFEQDGQRLVPLGGIAFSGARGISRVEVRVDGGPWQEARLRSPLSDTTWVIWRYDWPFVAGSHTFEVRCFEADGNPQITEVNKPRPSGATGIHQVEGTY